MGLHKIKQAIASGHWWSLTEAVGLFLNGQGVIASEQQCAYVSITAWHPLANEIM